MAKVVKNEINHFLGRLKGLQSGKYNDEIADAIGEDGVAIAKEQYNLNPESTIIVDKTDAVNGEVVVYSQGEQVAYLEYGVGEKGRGTYDGNLKFDISFHSNKLGRQVNLDEWTYSYANKETEKEKTPEPKIEGHEAYAQMFKTAQELRRKYKAERRK